MAQGSILTQKPSTGKSISHHMAAQELLREMEHPEVVDKSKTTSPVLDEVFRDYDNYLAKILHINPTDWWNFLAQKMKAQQNTK